MPGVFEQLGSKFGYGKPETEDAIEPCEFNEATLSSREASKTTRITLEELKSMSRGPKEV